MTRKIAMVLAVVLLLSLLANLATGWAYLSKRDALAAANANIAAATSRATMARVAAAACSASVQALAEEAKALAFDRDAARKQAQAIANKHYARADAILSTPPADPDNACVSAQARVAQVLANRTRTTQP